MTAYYASWYREVLLRKATDFQREVIFSPNKDSFANFNQQERHMMGMMNPEDYTNPQVWLFYNFNKQFLKFDTTKGFRNCTYVALAAVESF